MSAPLQPMHHWTKREDDEVWRRYLAGESFPEIAEALGFTKGQIRNHVAVLRVRRGERPPETWTPEIDEALWARHLARTPTLALMAEFGRSKSQIKNRLERLRKTHAERRVDPAVDRNDAEIAALYADGTEIGEIARAVGVTKGVVGHRLQALRKLAADMPPRRRGVSGVLSPFDVNLIRILRASGATQQAIADKFGCSRETVSAIGTGRRNDGVRDYLEILNAEHPENG